jgi:tRNA threonylcarbamoyladenosine biosynthesis protein TsaE
MEDFLPLYSEDDTCELAEIISSQVQSGDVIALSGELGCGKTFFSKCLCKYLGVQEYVSSPSYIILNEYEGIFQIAHFDLYRLNNAEEVMEIGLQDFIEKKLTIIEWYEVAQNLLPAHTIFMDFTFENDLRIVHIHTTKNLILHPLPSK